MGFFFFFLYFFFRQLLSKLAERNSTKIGHILGSKSNFKMHVQNPEYPSTYKSRVQKQLFSTTSQLNGKFDGLYLRNETCYT